VDRGNVVAANASPLLVIQRLDPIYVDFTVTEHDLNGRAAADVRQVAEGRGPHARPALRAARGRGDLPGQRRAEGTGTVTLRATVVNPRRRLWPGRFVNVRLVLATLPKAVVVPATAPQISPKGPFVYVVKEDDTAELRLIKPGRDRATSW